jgi:hypothetical protein
MAARPKSTKDKLGGFKESTKWKVLLANNEAVAEPLDPTFACSGGS